LTVFMVFKGGFKTTLVVVNKLLGLFELVVPCPLLFC
jgi:hypothetical protein